MRDPSIVSRLIHRRRTVGPLSQLTDRQVLELATEGRADNDVCETLVLDGHDLDRRPLLPVAIREPLGG